MAAFAKNLLRWTSGRLVGSPVVAPPIQSLPTAPQPDQAGLTAIAAARRRRLLAPAAPAKGGTLLTGPSGLESAAPTQRQTLLGG
jgi:hypothetical protein